MTDSDIYNARLTESSVRELMTLAARQFGFEIDEVEVLRSRYEKVHFDTRVCDVDGDAGKDSWGDVED